MKKSDKLARKTRKMIAKNLIVLATLAVVAFAGVMSWFTQNTRAIADGINVETKVEDGLEFYIMPPSDSDQYAAIKSRFKDNAKWNSKNPNETPRRTTWHTSSEGAIFDFTEQEFKFMEGLFLCEVTSDGTVFQVPKLMQYDEVAYVDTTQDFDVATPNDEYLSFDLYFRSDTAQSGHDVLMQSDSSITPLTTLSEPSYANASDNPAVKDAAIGAVRMAVYNGNTCEVLWIPGPYVYYNGSNDTLYTGLTSSDYSNKGAAYYDGTGISLRSNEGTDTHAYYSDKDHRSVVSPTAQNSPIVAGSTLGSDTSVLTLDSYDSVDGYYYGHIRVNLWIEGEDAEARLAFVGGKFSMSLNFKMT